MEKKKKKKAQMEETTFCKYQQDCWLMEEWEWKEGGIWMSQDSWQCLKQDQGSQDELMT